MKSFNAVMVVLVAASMGLIKIAQATAPLNGCNNQTGECRARIVTVYSSGNAGFVVLEGHLIPAICTNAGWGYYWSLNLTDTADRARYSTLLAAYMADKVVEIRTSTATCAVTGVGLGE